MSYPTNVILYCPNGHGTWPQGAARFCLRCGVTLMVSAPQQPMPPTAQQPTQPTPQQLTTAQQPMPQSAMPASGGANPAFNNAPAQNIAPNITPMVAPPPSSAPAMVNMNIGVQFAPQCPCCGGAGQLLNPKFTVCPQCGWLRPLAHGYTVDPSAFVWAQDGSAMAKLRSIGPLNSAARGISDKVGRRWIETSLNGIRLGDDQFPQIYNQAVRAARLLGLPYMPDVYLSGEQAWNADVYGSDKESFLVIGTALVMNFQGDDLLFLLAREMGHVRAGHALWKTVLHFLVGAQGPSKGMMSGGILSMIANPFSLIEDAVELPLLGWARQAEITADRAGLLAVGSEEIARRALLSWTLKSSLLYRHLNVEAWLRQQAEDYDGTMQMSEMVQSSTPYISRRLNILKDYARSPELTHWRTIISAASANESSESKTSAASNQKPPASGAKDDVRLICAACKTGMRIPRKVLADKDSLNVRCPNQKCGKTITLRKKQPTPPPPPSAQQLNELNANTDD